MSWKLSGLFKFHHLTAVLTCIPTNQIMDPKRLFQFKLFGVFTLLLQLKKNYLLCTYSLLQFGPSLSLNLKLLPSFHPPTVIVFMPYWFSEYFLFTVFIHASFFYRTFAYSISSLCKALCPQHSMNAYALFILQFKCNFPGESFLCFSLSSNQNIIGRHKPYSFTL